MISIIILNYNRLEYLKRTLKTIKNLTYQNKEIIVVDNASTDGSVSWLEKQTSIKLIKNKSNTGYSKGKNIGAKHSRGKYLFLLDNDVLIQDSMILQKVIKKINEKEILTFVLAEENKKVAHLWGGFFWLFGIKRTREVLLKKVLSYKGDIYCGFVMGPAIFIKKRDWKVFFGGFDERQPYMLDDFDLSMKAWIYGFKCKTFNESYLINLGVLDYQNHENFIWKVQFQFSGFATAIFKNYKISNILLYFPFFIFGVVIKVLKNLIVRRRLDILVSFLKSIHLFFINLPETLMRRRAIQRNRTVHSDLFLQIKAPKFD